MAQKIGILPLARPTFDVSFANQKFDLIKNKLEDSSYEIVGPSEMLLHELSALSVLDEFEEKKVDQILIVQLTFTDASLVVKTSDRFSCPLSIWSIPEPRTGGRLRLNSLCGLNLASHALGLNNRVFSWLYSDPSTTDLKTLISLLNGEFSTNPLSGMKPEDIDSEIGKTIAWTIKGKRIACIGKHPAGFDTCKYDKNQIKNLAGVNVDEINLDNLFDAASNVSKIDSDMVREEAETKLTNLTDLNQEELEKSLKLKVALDQIKSQGNYDAFAIRCWPETFTEYGGAVCGPVSMLGETKVPCACEADVYGSLTQLILQEAANDVVFLADLVDVDIEDETAVVWHCGQAPLSMCPEYKAEATIHTNRKMPLLFEFGLKQGPVTFLRISQAFGEVKMVISFGEMLDRPMAFTGTSGVFKPEKDAKDFLNNVIDSGLEHHMALAYGDHRDALRSVANAIGIKVLEI